MIINGTKLSMVRGDTESITVTIRDTSGEITPLVSGDTIYFTLKKNAKNELKLIQKVITTFIDGSASIVISHDDTRNLLFGDYMYDVQVTYENGTVKTILGPDIFTILEEVTYE